MRRLTNLFFFIVVLTLLSSCTNQELSDYKAAESEISKGHYRIAISYLEKVIKRNKTEELVLQSLREAARISEYEIKDQKRAIEFYRQLVLKSPDHDERVFAQKQVANLVFNNLQDYERSITEFSKLITFITDPKEIYDYKLNIARAYFYRNQHYQAHSELDNLLKQNLSDETRFSVLQLKGNLYLAEKKFKEAIAVFTELSDEHPERAFAEKIGLTLAVCYEESGDFKGAVRTLESYLDKYQPKEYIELRIKRLIERQKNAPGAKGFRK